MDDQAAKGSRERLGAMERDQLVDFLRHLACTFEVDFTDEFLATLSLQELRHIAAEAALHTDAALLRESA